MLETIAHVTAFPPTLERVTEVESRYDVPQAAAAVKERWCRRPRSKNSPTSTGWSEAALTVAQRMTGSGRSRNLHAGTRNPLGWEISEEGTSQVYPKHSDPCMRRRGAESSAI